MFSNTPRFVFGASEFIPSLPARFWDPSDETVGGSRTAASGVPASYIVRRDALIDVPVRFTEAEWPAFLALIAFGQSAQSFTWYPDAAEAESFPVYLESPTPGERWKPTRSGEYPRVFEHTPVFRGVGGVVPWRSFFP